MDHSNHNNVFSTYRKMVPPPSPSPPAASASAWSSSSRGSLYEFQKLPYNPATPIRPQSTLESLGTTLKTAFYFVQFLAKSVPVWFGLLGEWLNPRPLKNIAGWNALVTGGSNGIGRSICIELAKQGCNVIIVDMDADNGEKMVQNLIKLGVKATFYEVDVTDYDAVMELSHKVEHDFGPVDILVNNAGIFPSLILEQLSSANVRRMMDVNVMAHFWTIEAFLPGMYERRRGHVVGLASLSSYIPSGLFRTYTTSKYAVRGFMEDLNDEIYRAGLGDVVNTTTVFPNVMNTRKELIEEFATLPLYSTIRPESPELAGKQIVAAIRANTRKLYVTGSLKTWMLALFEDLPRRIARLLIQELYKG